MTDFKEQCICIKLLFQIGKIDSEIFQMLTFAFREEAMRQNVVFDCSAESRNVEHIYGIWHESICITIHKLADQLGSLMVYAIKF